MDLAGNIGRSLALQVAEDPHEYYIIELSSFQLDNMYDFHANIAILLNITPDHLDRYDYCMQNYVDAKMRIIQNQTDTDSFIYWNDDPVIKRELEKYDIKAIQYPFSELKEKALSAYMEDGEIHHRSRLTVQHGAGGAVAHRQAQRIQLACSRNRRQHRAASRRTLYARALSDFPGVEHRLEKVCKVGGVQYVNDSKATNVDACWYALESMNTPTILIIGGKDKGNDYNEINELVKQKCSALVFLGADNTKLHNFFDEMGVNDTRHPLDEGLRGLHATNWHNRATPCCSARAAPASTSSRTWRTVANSSRH